MTTELGILSISSGEDCLSTATADAEPALKRQQLFHAYTLKLQQQLNMKKDIVIDFTCLQLCLDPQPDWSSLFPQDKVEEEKVCNAVSGLKIFRIVSNH